MKKIVMTGGGTAGHVTPNVALMPALKEKGYQIFYIGSHDGIERGLIEAEGIPYYGISSGKLRRYFDLKNFTDPFKVVKGYFDAKRILKKLKPDVIFSKGGFVTVPVVLAAKSCKIPAIIHESDMTPGLANKLSIPSAYKVCHNFPETANYLPEGKSVLSGSPIRQELLKGSRAEGLKICGFTTEKPVILVIGGSLGSVAINTAVRKALPVLLPHYQIIHICGKGKVDTSITNVDGYIQFDYVQEELNHLLAAADLVISRAGSNSICEFVALKKPNILIPLPATTSRGDQLLNAASFEKQGFSYLLQEEDVTDETLTQAVHHVFEYQEGYVHAMLSNPTSNAIEVIVNLCEEASKRK